MIICRRQRKVKRDEPVKVVDLAKDMIILSGLQPGEDIGIEFTGIRPGEKLYCVAQGIPLFTFVYGQLINIGKQKRN